MDEIARYYEGGHEVGRLERSAFARLEMVRMQELTLRFLPQPPAAVVDIGGGPGVYACWLAARGYQVDLVDASPLHVDLARRASERQPEAPLRSVQRGDARSLEHDDESIDAVLFFGPLYHLTEREDRLQALREARRVLRPGGVLLAVAISRFASLIDGLRKGFLDDPVFAAMVERDLADGQHRNPTAMPEYFTTAYLHRPDELEREILDAGLRWQGTYAVEGPSWLAPDLTERWADYVRREQVLGAVRAVEEETWLLGVSAHIMAVSRKAAAPATTPSRPRP